MKIILTCVMVNFDENPVFQVGPKSGQLETPEVHSYCLVHFFSYLLMYYIGHPLGCWDFVKFSPNQS